MTRRTRPVARAVVLAALLLTLLPTPARAAPGPAVRPVFAGYWGEFADHWAGKLRQQNGVVMFALGVGGVGLLIITRGKWLK